MISKTNEELAERTVDFDNLRSDANIMESKNYAEKKDIERIEDEIREQTGISRKYCSEISRLKDIANSRDIDNENLLLRIDAMEAEVVSNNNRMAHLQEVKEQKDLDLEN